MMSFRRIQTLSLLFFGIFVFLLSGCESCKEKPVVQALPLPFSDNFNRESLGSQWFTERPGRWKIEFDDKTKNGKVCGWQARNMPLFLKGALPRNVVIEFDAWAYHRDGDVKVELFTDGRFHATGYVLVHGGWNNTWSIIDRLDEHSRNCRREEANKPVHCRRVKRGGPTLKRKYHWTIKRIGSVVSWSVDGRPFLSYPDPMPLEGENHKHFAFSNWIARICFDNLKIRKAEAPKAAPQPRQPAAIVRPQQPAVRKAPTPSTIQLQPKPLAQTPEPVRNPIPRPQRLPQPTIIQLHRAPTPKKGIRLFQPRLLRPGQMKVPTLYKRRPLQLRSQPRR